MPSTNLEHIFFPHIDSIQCNLREAEDLSELISWLATMAASNEERPLPQTTRQMARVWRGIGFIQEQLYENLSNASEQSRKLLELAKTIEPKGGAR